MRLLTRTVTVLLTMVMVMACSNPEPVAPLTDAPFHTTIDAAKVAAVDGNKYIIVDFYTDRCRWCATIDTVVLKDSTVIDFFSNEMVLVKLNAEVDSAIAQEFFVRGYPTLVMMDKDGLEVDRLVGYLPPDEFIETFRNYAKGIGTLDDLVHRADTATSDDRALYFEIADKYKYRGQGKEAIQWFQRIVDTGDPLDSLTGEARIALADALRSAEQYDQSIAALKGIAADFKGGLIGQDAEIWMAISYRDKGDTAQAVKEFEAFVKNYPEHEAVGYCEGQVGKLTGVPEIKEGE